MHADDSFGNQAAERHLIEDFLKFRPKLGATIASTFFVEAVETIYLRAFMVAPQNVDVGWMEQLVREQEHQNFN